jgi:hypothetical protein
VSQFPSSIGPALQLVNIAAVATEANPAAMAFGDRTLSVRTLPTVGGLVRAQAWNSKNFVDPRAAR